MTEDEPRFQFFGSDWARRHALFSSKERCYCGLPLPHGDLFHPTKRPLVLFPTEEQEEDEHRCPYCGANTTLKYEEGGLEHRVCPNDSGSLHPCPMVVWEMGVGRGPPRIPLPEATE